MSKSTTPPLQLIWFANAIIALTLLTTVLWIARTQPHTHTLRQTTLNIQGMTCTSCVMHIDELLMKTKGVKKADVWLKPQRAIILYDPRQVRLKKLINIIEKAGYQVLNHTPIPHNKQPPHTPQ